MLIGEDIMLPEDVVALTVGFEVQGIGDLSFTVKDSPGHD